MTQSSPWSVLSAWSEIFWGALRVSASGLFWRTWDFFLNPSRAKLALSFTTLACYEAHHPGPTPCVLSTRFSSYLFRRLTNLPRSCHLWTMSQWWFMTRDVGAPDTVRHLLCVDEAPLRSPLLSSKSKCTRTSALGGDIGNPNVHTAIDGVDPRAKQGQACRLGKEKAT